jgi:hypothetical protein
MKINIAKYFYGKLTQSKESDTQMTLSVDTEHLEDIAKLQTKFNLHVIGNSHAHSFTGSPTHEFGQGSNLNKPWKSYSLGPLSSVDFLSTKKIVFEKFIDKYRIQPGSRLLFTFGEAECRWYIPKDFNERKGGEESVSIEDSLERFLKAAQSVILEYSERGFEVIVWGGHPSTGRSLKDQLRDEKNIPIITSFNDRLETGLRWHNKMQDFAKQNDLQFISIFPSMVSENRETYEYYLTDDCHIKTEILEGFILSQLSVKSYLL